MPDLCAIPRPGGDQHAHSVDDRSLAEEIPALYRAILDGVARLEQAGQRREAHRLRSDATGTYSRAWDDANRRRLEAVLRRLERAIEGSPAPATTGSTLVRSEPA
jgi:hypothetical protein